jgi:hypothetical protein
MKQSAFDGWLTTQPDQGLTFITAPDYMGDGPLAEYPVDEWTCLVCDKGVGFWITGDHAGSFTDFWLLEEDDQMMCEDCFATKEVIYDLPEQPDCDRCGALAGDEHAEACHK